MSILSNPQVKIWLGRVAAALLGVVVMAVAGVRADLGHFGMWFPIVMAAQVFLLTALKKLIDRLG